MVGYHHHRAGRDRAAIEGALARSDQIATENGLKQTEFVSRCFRSYYASTWRDYATAKASIAGLESTLSESRPMNSAQFHLASYFIALATQDAAEAVRLYQKGIDTDDLAEELYQGLMRCLNGLDRRAEAMAVFRRLRQTLSVTLGISPSSRSERLFRSMQQEG